MRRLLAAIGFVGSLWLVVLVAPATATGDCVGEGYVLLYKNAGFSGTPVKICSFINDTNMATLGPDVNGNYHSGWHDVLSSFKVRGAPGADYGVCFYRNENFSSLWHQSTLTEDWNIDIFNNDETDSIEWGAISPISGRATC